MFEVLNTVTLDEQDGGTLLTLHARVVKTRPEAARHLEGMAQGWTQSLERLGAHLANPIAAVAREPACPAHLSEHLRTQVAGPRAGGSGLDRPRSMR